MKKVVGYNDFESFIFILCCNRCDYFFKNEIRLADKEPLQFKENKKKIVQSFDFKFI